jgi:disulfide bond formation protein DsbB
MQAADRLRPAAALAATLAAGLGLGTALASERWGGLVPCALCLVERWPYQFAIAFGALALLLPRLPARVMLTLFALSMLTAAGLGALHVGVEWKFWPSPLPECAAPHFTPGNIAQRLAEMPAKPSKPCDEPVYLIPFLPVSMAMMNMLYALALAVGMTIYLLKSRERRA